MSNRLLEKKRWNGNTWDDVIKLYNIHLPNCDYSSTIELDKRVSKILNIPITYARKVRLSKFNIPNNVNWKQEKFLIENAFEYSFPKSFFGPYMIECNNDVCYEIQKYTTKSSLLRVLGYEHSAYNTTKEENKGLCGECSRTAKRKSHPPRSKKWLLNNRLKEIKKLGFNTIEEYEENIFIMGKKDSYYNSIDNMSRTNLKREKPELYKLWDENKWDGTDDSQLTIEHSIPKSMSWKERIPAKEVAHIDNLDVITMKENNDRWRKYLHSIGIKKVLIGEKKFEQLLKEKDDWAWKEDKSSVPFPNKYLEKKYTGAKITNEKQN
jgi:hypothetical protein